MNLKGKTAIVTGGGRDIGRACAMRLAKEGAQVAINYHSSSEGADSAVDEILSLGGKAFAKQGDMTDQADVEALINETRNQFGDEINVLVHVTGGLVARKKFDEMDHDHWKTVMDLNVTSLFHLSKATIPFMPSGSSIIPFASQAGRDGGGPGAIAYATSKGAVMTMTRGMAKELGPTIRVNALCPGMIDTDFHNTFTKPEVRKNVSNAAAVKREGTSDEVANLVAFLASEESSFMTGTCLDINGGILFS
ncbi:MAG: SDR family oxidoreductase [Hyphomicrobiales bacterium]